MYDPFGNHDSDFPKNLTKIIDDRRITNNNRFSSKEIFREEFLKFIDMEVMSRFQHAMNNTFKRNRECHEEALKVIKADQKDLWYGLDKINTTLTGLIEVALKPRLIMNPNKKEK